MMTEIVNPEPRIPCCLPGLFPHLSRRSFPVSFLILLAPIDAFRFGGHPNSNPFRHIYRAFQHFSFLKFAGSLLPTSF